MWTNVHLLHYRMYTNTCNCTGSGSNMTTVSNQINPGKVIEGTIPVLPHIILDGHGITGLPGQELFSVSCKKHTSYWLTMTWGLKSTVWLRSCISFLLESWPKLSFNPNCTGLFRSPKGPIAAKFGTHLRNCAKRKISVLFFFKTAYFISYDNLCKLYA